MVIANGQWKKNSVQKEKYKFWGRNMYYHTSLACLHRKFWAGAPLSWSQNWGLSSMCSLSRVRWKVTFWFGFIFFFLYRGKFTIPKLSSNSFVTHWFTCAARAAIFHSNLNISDLSHREDALAPQHTEHPQEPPPQDLGKIWGKWEMACSTDSLQNLRKQNDPCLLIFQDWNLPPDTLIFYSKNLYPRFVWGNKMGGKTNFKSEQIKMV